MSRISEKISVEILKKAVLSILIFAAILAAYIFYVNEIVPNISPELFESLKKYINSVFVIAAGFVVSKTAGAALGWYHANVASKTKTQLDDKLVPIIQRTAKVIIWIIATLIILPFFGVNINALVAALGVGSLAIALAAQDTIANIIAGFLIMIDSPFRIGDRIKLPTGENVKVLEIGVRRSRFVSDDKAIIIVPNVDLCKNKIINYTYGEEFNSRVLKDKQPDINTNK
ncbi:MAG: mechanosensitive ion channel domain-containing protein [Elusimicrobiota bacterium]